jgi:hypothetical protein
LFPALLRSRIVPLSIPALEPELLSRDDEPRSLVNPGPEDSSAAHFMVDENGA